MTTPLPALRTLATQHARWEQRTRTALGGRKFQQFYDYSTTLTLDQTIAYALK